MVFPDGSCNLSSFPAYTFSRNKPLLVQYLLLFLTKLFPPREGCADGCGHLTLSERAVYGAGLLVIDNKANK